MMEPCRCDTFSRATGLTRQSMRFALEATEPTRGAQWCDVQPLKPDRRRWLGPLEMAVKSFGQPLPAACGQPKRVFPPN